jgi:hypothetical protein
MMGGKGALEQVSTARGLRSFRPQGEVCVGIIAGCGLQDDRNVKLET